MAAIPGAEPLSPMQLVYLTRELVDPDGRTNHCLLFWEVVGELDEAALTTAIGGVHERHEALRAAYRADPWPHAVVVDVPPPPLLVLDPAPSVAVAAQALRAELGEELFVADAEVWRAALAPVAGGRAVFGLVVHHIAFDGWSQAVLAADLGTAYLAAAAGSTPTWPSAAVGLAAARRAPTIGVGREEVQRRLDRTVAELTGVGELRWPGDVPPDAARRQVREVEVLLTPEQAVRVEAIAAAAGVTRFVVLLTAWYRALAAVTGSDDFAVGVPVAQRHAPGLEDAVGCHLTMACLRLRPGPVGGDNDELLRVARSAYRALAAQDVPLDAVLRSVRGNGTHRSPVFQTLFALQDNRLPVLPLAGVHTRLLRQRYLDLPLELHAEIWPTEQGGLTMVVSYLTTAVAPEVARRCAQAFAVELERLGRPRRGQGATARNVQSSSAGPGRRPGV